MTSALSITRSVGTPRGVFLDFPLGHTAGKKHEKAMQREILLESLAAFEEMKTPGEIKSLPFRWSEDESWRENPMGGGRGLCIGFRPAILSWAPFKLGEK